MRRLRCALRCGSRGRCEVQRGAKLRAVVRVLAHDEAERGTITVGKPADLVVLSRNLFATDPLAIHAIDVDMTLIGGRVVFERR